MILHDFLCAHFFEHVRMLFPILYWLSNPQFVSLCTFLGFDLAMRANLSSVCNARMDGGHLGRENGDDCPQEPLVLTCL